VTAANKVRTQRNAKVIWTSSITGASFLCAERDFTNKVYPFSDSVTESQPTQLLQHALTKQKPFAEHSDEWGLNHECEQDRNLSANFSIDSMMIPPARGSTSRHQLNWLAPTQMQPQVLYKDQEIIEEGSQKENTPAESNKNKHENIERTRSSSPQASVNVKGSHADPLSHPESHTASGIGKANGEPLINFCNVYLKIVTSLLPFSPKVCFLSVSSFGKACPATSPTYQVSSYGTQTTPEISFPLFARFLRWCSVTRSCSKLHSTGYSGF
jgi:hypothetical protein